METKTMAFEEKIMNLISFFEHMAEKASREKEKWDGTNTTYGDTDRYACDVEAGREEAFYEAAGELQRALFKNP